MQACIDNTSAGSEHFEGEPTKSVGNDIWLFKARQDTDNPCLLKKF